MRTRGVSLAGFAVFLYGCREANLLHDSFDPSQMTNSRLLECVSDAPIVVVGRVLRTETIEAAVPASRRKEWLLEQVEALVDGENVLRGALEKGPFRFRYFTVSRKGPGYSGPRTFHVEAGDRRVFFLTREGEHLRSFRDVLDYTLVVQTGKHWADRPGSTVGAEISRILLTIGEESDGDAFAAAIERTAQLSDQLASRPATVELLRALVRDRHSKVKAAACITLSRYYPCEFGCLNDLRADSAAGDSDRMEAEKLLQKRPALDALLRARLQHDPLSVLASGVPDTRDRVRDEFELLTANPDPEIRKLACENRRRLFPDAVQCLPSRPNR